MVVQGGELCLPTPPTWPEVLEYLFVTLLFLNLYQSSQDKHKIKPNKVLKMTHFMVGKQALPQV